MTLMSDNWIREQCLQAELLSANAHARVMSDRPNNWKPMIEPFVDGQVKTKLIHEGTTDEYERRIPSYGLSSAGYDIRLKPEFKIFTNINSIILDPENFDDRCFIDHKGDECIIPPHGFVLSLTEEYIRVPRDVMITCIGKSTLARCGLNVIVTPLEPEWEGNVVIEIANLTSLPVRIRAGVGIAQFLFHKLDQPVRVSYADRAGKYNKQTTLQVAKV